MGADALTHVLRPLASIFGDATPNLLVGLGVADDAAVYRLSDELAVVATADFFPPVVDDPATFGAIAAANALSDIYAMGATPLFALNLVAFPDNLDPEILTDILRGGAEKVREAGAVIAGGHTITDDEPKYGLAAIGVTHPERVLTKGGARPGDALILTKPLGAGILSTAQKNGATDEAFAGRHAAAVANMLTLNAGAARALISLGANVHACTDITGFGLLGHAYEMASQSSVHFDITLSALPWLPGARDYAAAGYVPGGTARNADYLREHVTLGSAVSETDRRLLFDPQTSGGLFAAIAGDALDRVQAAFTEAGVPCHVVGSVAEGEGISVE